MSDTGVREADAILCLGAWLGFVLDRLRRGEAPFPPGAGENEIRELAMSFGARWMDTVPAWAYSRVPRIPALDAMLGEIHTHSRNQPWEQLLWEDGILAFVPTPLPPAIAHHLIDRDIAHAHFAHSHQEEEIWWRLVDEFPEAVENLAEYRYKRPEDDWRRVEEVLHQFPWPDLLSLLARTEPSSRDKAVALAERIRAHPERLNILRHTRRLNPTFVSVWSEVAGDA